VYVVPSSVLLITTKPSFVISLSYEPGLDAEFAVSMCDLHVRPMAAPVATTKNNEITATVPSDLTRLVTLVVKSTDPFL